MTTFLISLAVLVGGYFVYGAVAEKVFGVEPSRPTPAVSQADGVDYMVMPTWKVFLIQFLNIAGLGPIFGAIMGVMFGPAAFLWIVFGTIFAGGVHDFVSAMMSVRSGGASLPEIVGDQLGRPMRHTVRIFSVVVLILVASVFILTPASILDTITPKWMDVTLWTAVIFIYYILATLLPIDKVIGRLYPIFGFALLFMAAGIICVLLFSGVTIPDGLWEGLHTRQAQAATHPVFPMMFVSIACGAISGFHATQSPMMARCLKNERLARPVFYGAMVAEGIVALIWAAAAIAFVGGYDRLTEYFAQDGHTTGRLVADISMGWMGTLGGILTLLGVVVAPITTGDTALRAARLTVADMARIDQHRLVKRLLISLPVFALVFLVIQIDYQVLWRYFAWANQTLAAITLWAATVYLARHGRHYVLTLVPAAFMTVVSVSYVLFAARPEGLGLPWGWSVGAGVAVALLLTGLCLQHLEALRHTPLIMHNS